jgi:hypothetical protein
MATGTQPWLVEIRVKDWVHVPEGQSRTVTYEEVLAGDAISARHAGFDQFKTRCQYEPVMRRTIAGRKLELTDCCAPDAVQID